MGSTFDEVLRRNSPQTALSGEGGDLFTLPGVPGDRERIRSALESVTVDSTAFNEAVKNGPPGVDPLVVAREPDVFKTDRNEENAKIIDDRPALKRNIFEDSGFVSAVNPEGGFNGLARGYDDFSNAADSRTLVGTTIETFSSAGKEFVKTNLMIASSTLAMAEISDALLGTSLSSDENRTRIDGLMQRQAELEGSYEGLPLPAKAFSLSVGQLPFLAGNITANVGATYLTRSPAVGKAASLAFVGTVEGGGFYNSLTRERPDLDKFDVAAVAMLVGAVNGALEFIPFEKLKGTFKTAARQGARRLIADRAFREICLKSIRAVVQQMAAEGFTEVLQEISGVAGKSIVKWMAGEMTIEEVFFSLGSDEAIAQYKKSAELGALGSSGPSMVASGIGLADGNRRQNSAKRTREIFQAISDTTVSNKEMIGQMPSRYKQMVEDAADEGGQRVSTSTPAN